MKRRDLLRGAAGALALTLPPARAAALLDNRWDFIIVGAGTAGLPAAIHASRRGASVLLLEAADKLGGTLNMAQGQISAGGTRLQEALGIADSPDRHYEDIMDITFGEADPTIVRRTVDLAPDTLNWILDQGLVPLPGHPVTGDAPGRPAYSVRRYFWAAEAGRAILKVVLEEFNRELPHGRIATRLNTRVNGLLMTDAGTVEGVRAESGGEEFAFRGRHVLLTSGGYAMNPDMFELLTGHPPYAAGAWPHSLGDGLELAVSVGGWLRGQRLHRAGTGSILTVGEFPAKVYARFSTVPQQRLPWEIWVNDRGQRFIREDEPLVRPRAQAVLRLPRLRYVIVFDQHILDTAPPGLPDFTREQFLEHCDNHPMFTRADSLAELAEKAEVDLAGLEETVRAYNAAVASGGDSFGRQHLPAPISRPPYYGITHLGSSATSSAGVAVNAEMQVLRGDSEPIPGLYATGEVLGSGSTLGSTFAPGMMLTPALSLGRWLGMTLPV
ncbi:FAD-dependent oxidoreductase [Candidatus Foliamicus sp.]